jgi:hypothetical protein
LAAQEILDLCPDVIDFGWSNHGAVLFNDETANVSLPSKMKYYRTLDAVPQAVVATSLVHAQIPPSTVVAMAERWLVGAVSKLRSLDCTIPAVHLMTGHFWRTIERLSIACPWLTALSFTLDGNIYQDTLSVLNDLEVSSLIAEQKTSGF